LPISPMRPRGKSHGRDDPGRDRRLPTAATV
jgi:hypothetical protein